MTHSLSSELLQSHAKASGDSNHLKALTLLVLLAGSLLGFLAIGVFGYQKLGALLVMGAIAASIGLMIALELTSAARIHDFLRVCSDADLEALLLAPAEAEVWPPAVQFERARRAALAQGGSLAT